MLIWRGAINLKSFLNNCTRFDFSLVKWLMKILLLKTALLFLVKLLHLFSISSISLNKEVFLKSELERVFHPSIERKIKINCSLKGHPCHPSRLPSCPEFLLWTRRWAGSFKKEPLNPALPIFLDKKKNPFNSAYLCKSSLSQRDEFAQMNWEIP